ncbi:hypothetical protein GCM10027422_30880 [Hymenobacter arcticus]
MLRNPVKLGVLVGGLALASLPGLPAAAQNPTVAAPATNIAPPDVRARMWAATARFVYGDDPTLASLRPQLRQTIDSGSVKAFGRHLEDAVKLENKSLPQLEHVLKFQGDFKTISAKNEQPAALATSIANRLRDNKPERQNQAAFGQLRQALHALADPNAPVPTPVATAAILPAGSDTTAESASRMAAVMPPAKDFTITNSAPNPMLTYLALALSVISLLVSLLKGNSKKRHRHHDSASPSLATLTDEMRAEVRTIVQREVSNKVPGARPAPAPATTPPTKPQAAASAAAKPAQAPTAKATSAPQLPAQPSALAVSAAPVAAPVPAAPVTATPTEADTFFTDNYPVAAEAVAAPPAAAPTRTLYANQQPIDGIFQRNMLAEAPASYTIFELITAADTPDQARFVVTGNPAGHAGYIGSHQNILGGACEYPFPKGSVSRIITDAPGVAQRTANGDWQISKKAQIHFE